MKLLITGSNGLLGQKLIKLVLDKGTDELIATARGTNRLPYPEDNYTFDQLDITDHAQVISVIDKHKPDVVIHTAAMTNVDQCETEKEDCWKQNVDAVAYLIEACQSTNSFLVHLSTDFIFDGEFILLGEDGENILSRSLPLAFKASGKTWVTKS